LGFHKSQKTLLAFAHRGRAGAAEPFGCFLSIIGIIPVYLHVVLRNVILLRRNIP
jgi:hypothetical protein